MKKLFLSLGLIVLCGLAAMADCTVFYTGTYSKPYVYAWTNGGEMTWPGKAMTKTNFTYSDGTNTSDIWSYTLSANYSFAIFSNNGSPQTSNLSCDCGKLYVESKDEWIDYAGTGNVLDTAQAVIVDTHGKVVPIESEDIMLQGFYWDSDKSDAPYGRTKWIDLLADSSSLANFDIIWLPSPVRSSGGLGYHPTQWSSFDSGLGTKVNLLKLIAALHRADTKVVADIVVNHRANSNDWCSFFPDKFGSDYASPSSPTGNYQFTAEHIVSDDEAFSDTKSSCYGSTVHGAPDSGTEPWTGARDLDHTNPYVQDAVKSYLAFLQNEAGFDGWRYDLVKSYAPKYLEMYNLASMPYISVSEYWDGLSAVKSYLRRTNYHTMAFDFPMKFKAFNQGIQTGAYGNLKSSTGEKLSRAEGLSRYAVTFIDNHDTFKRGDRNEFCDGTGAGKSLSNTANHAKVLEANAYLLSMPGLPCVFYPHWVTFRSQIKKLMQARRIAGIHSESEVTDEASATNSYSAVVHGKHGTLLLRLGTARDTTTPQGYVLYTSGERYSVYLNITDGTWNDLEQVTSAPAATKLMENGTVVILRDGKRYSVLGQPIE